MIAVLKIWVLWNMLMFWLLLCRAEKENDDG